MRKKQILSIMGINVGDSRSYALTRLFAKLCGIL